MPFSLPYFASLSTAVHTFHTTIFVQGLIRPKCTHYQQCLFHLTGLLFQSYSRLSHVAKMEPLRIATEWLQKLYAFHVTNVIQSTASKTAGKSLHFPTKRCLRKTCHQSVGHCILDNKLKVTSHLH